MVTDAQRHKDMGTDTGNHRGHKVIYNLIFFMFCVKQFKAHHDYCHQRRSKAVFDTASKEHCKSPCSQHAAQKMQPHRLFGPSQNLVKLLAELDNVRLVDTDIPAQIVEIIQTIKIGLIANQSSDMGQDSAVRRFHRHLNIGSDDKHIYPLCAVTFTHAQNAVLHAADLRAAADHLFSNI